MYFGLSFDNGFVVSATFVRNGILASWPLRKFFTEGDAKIFRYDDCPKLDDRMIEYLIRGYKSSISFDRISNRCFRPHVDKPKLEGKQYLLF